MQTKAKSTFDIFNEIETSSARLEGWKGGSLVYVQMTEPEQPSVNGSAAPFIFCLKKDANHSTLTLIDNSA